MPELSWFRTVVTIYQFSFCAIVALLYDFCDLAINFFKAILSFVGIVKTKVESSSYAPLISFIDGFYQHRLSIRVYECYHRIVSSAPDTWINVIERKLSYNSNKNAYIGKIEEKPITCLNLGSYNYLGFGGNGGSKSGFLKNVIEELHDSGVSTCSHRSELGTTTLHRALEIEISKFLQKEDAIVCGMGFGINQTVLSTLFREGDLIISDSLNHTSIAIGCKLSGAKIRTFVHGDLADLERVIRQGIINGQPNNLGNHRAWNRILILVEGIYSMEGDICQLPEIIDLKKKYKCFLYVDEAHSIGALGKSGRGVTEFFNLKDTSDVDVLMGTFTKTFGSVGGYIASSIDVVNFLRSNCSSYVYSSSIPSASCQQILSVLQILQTKEGLDIIHALEENTIQFRTGLQKLGLPVMGDIKSPVVPVLLGFPANILAFSRECLLRKLAVVVVGYPATPMLYPRTRFCISAAHTKEDLEYAYVF